MTTFKFYDHKNCPACTGRGSQVFGTDGDSVCCDCNGLGEVPKSPDELRAEGIMLLAEAFRDLGFATVLRSIEKFVEERSEK